MLSRRRRGSNIIIMRITLSLLAALIFLLPSACRDDDTGSWRVAAEAEDGSTFLISLESLRWSPEDIVTVRVKYIPPENEFMASMKVISRAFGPGLKAHEYTISLWQFDCRGNRGRCLNLIHLRRGTKIASYNYPDQQWIPLEKTDSTRLLQQVVCGAARQVTYPTTDPERKR